MKSLLKAYRKSKRAPNAPREQCLAIFVNFGTSRGLPKSNQNHKQTKKEQNQQSKSVGLLSKNYAAALMEVSTHLNDAPVEIDHTVLDNMEAEVIRTEDQGVQS